MIQIIFFITIILPQYRYGIKGEISGGNKVYCQSPLFNDNFVYECKPGHRAQVVGDEPCVMIEFDASTAGDYAKE